MHPRPPSSHSRDPSIVNRGRDHLVHCQLPADFPQVMQPIKQVSASKRHTSVTLLYRSYKSPGSTKQPRSSLLVLSQSPPIAECELPAQLELQWPSNRRSLTEVYRAFADAIEQWQPLWASLEVRPTCTSRSGLMSLCPPKP